MRSLLSGISIPGVQQKVSMATGYKGCSFIVKSQVQGVKEAPQIENLWMTFSDILGLISAEHGLCILKNGSLAYFTKRFDRTKKGRLHVEDFSQLLNKATYQKDKYESDNSTVCSCVDEFVGYRTMG